MLRLAALTFLISTTALAQFQQIQLTFGTAANSAAFSPSSCGGQTTLNWTVLPSQQQACSASMALFVAETTCPDTGPATGDYDLGSAPLNRTGTSSGTRTIEFGRLPGFTGSTDGGAVCGSAVERSWKVCAVFEQANGFGINPCGTKTFVKKDVRISYDGRAPNAPTLTAAEGVERGIQISATLPADAKTVRFGSRISGSGAPFSFSTEVVAENSTAKARINGLENGVTYEVTAVAADEAGNRSGESNIIEAIPTETLGFWDAYKKAGGTEEGGCSSAPGVVTTAAIGFALWVSRRRRS